MEAEKREAAKAVPKARPGSRVGAGVGTRGRGTGRTTPAARTTTSRADEGRPGLTAGSGPSKTGRGAIAGYGRIGSAGTKPSTRGSGRGVG